MRLPSALSTCGSKWKFCDFEFPHVQSGGYLPLALISIEGGVADSGDLGLYRHIETATIMIMANRSMVFTTSNAQITRFAQICWTQVIKYCCSCKLAWTAILYFRYVYLREQHSYWAIAQLFSAAMLWLNLVGGLLRKSSELIYKISSTKKYYLYKFTMNFTFTLVFCLTDGFRLVCSDVAADLCCNCYMQDAEDFSVSCELATHEKLKI